ncbi:MAG: GTP-binding protein [Promethearchaeota archaeon]
MLQRLKKLKILVLGASGVGKTSILNNFGKKGNIKDAESLLGIQIFKYNMEINHYPYNFQFWDFKDDPRFDFTYPRFFKNANGALVIFDLTRIDTLKKAKKQILWVCKHLGYNIPFILMGNKIDLIEDLDSVIKRDDIIQYAKNLGGIYIEDYLDDLENLKIALKKLFELIIK